MHWLDWIIVVIPLFFIIGTAFYVKRYVRGVADFLVAGRVAGRYVISVADMESALGIITLVGYVESRYQTGFAILFWNNVLVPLTIFMSLCGFCLYRYRETKALSMGQFLEMRYSRNFRIAAMGLRVFSEMLTNAICPALAARFFICLLGFPNHLDIAGYQISTFAVVMFVLVVMSVSVSMAGGMVALIVTDCIQGLFCYPIFLILSIFIFTEFSWMNDIAPTMLDRAAGESFINPFDIDNLRDFNLFALIVSIWASIINRANWYGSNTQGCGRTSHEQKMAGVLGAWRGGFSTVFMSLIALAVFTTMNHRSHSKIAREVRSELSFRVADELIADHNLKQRIVDATTAIPEQKQDIGKDTPLSRKRNLDTTYLDATHNILQASIANTGEANSIFQQFNTLYHQTMLPVAMRKLFPMGLLGVFALFGFMIMLSTDDSRIFSSAFTLIQDIVLPLRKTPFTPEQQLRWIRGSTVFVGTVFFFGSLLMSQIDYVNLFVTICVSVWSGGAGSVIVFGLYSRFGTTAGAYASLLTGAFISGGGILVQRNWASRVYPLLERAGLVEPLGTLLATISEPLNPYVVWEMNPVKFPINSMELYLIAMLMSMGSYCLVSVITCRKPFNLEQMLHRGIYNIDGEDKKAPEAWSFRNIIRKIVGITPDYTTGDRLIAWGVFYHSIVYRFIIAFVLVVVWNLVAPWPIKWWDEYFFISLLLEPSLIGIITTVWFFIGGLIDLRQLFRDLAARKENPLDDGRVENGVSVADSK